MATDGAPPRALRVALFTAVLAFASLYAPQPLLPRLASELGLTADRAGLLISVTLFPLAIAPILYGALLESVSARRLLRGSVLVLAAGQVAFAAASTFELLVAIRFAQGLVLPAVLTSLMTYLSSASSPERVRRTMSAYIAATILGGLSGRLFAGAIASTALPWRAAFVVLGALMLVAWVGLGRLPSETRVGFTRVSVAQIVDHLKPPLFRRAFGIIFAVFFVFASLLNVVPFRLKTLDPSLSDVAIAAVYSSYAVGVVIAIASVRIAARLGGEVRAIRLGLALYLAATIGFVVSDVYAVFALMWTFCAGMFLVHALLSGLVNQHARGGRGVVNGLYLAAYYSGGTIGASLPALVLRHASWSVYLGVLVAMIGVALFLAMRMSPQDVTERRRATPRRRPR